jgi:cytochrome c-type biogenesis protein CcsB
MNIEILFKNGTFLSLFLSMISFWTENIFYDTKGASEGSLRKSGNQALFQNNFSEKLFNLSFFLITFELLYRWFLSGHPPLSNLYESLLFLIWGLIGFFLFIYRNERNNSNENVISKDILTERNFQDQSSELENSDGLTLLSDLNFDVKTVQLERAMSPRNFVGCILSSTALFIQTFADWRLPSEMRDIKPLIPALQSNWLLMHVSIMILSYAALLIGCIIAITYIVISFQTGEKELSSPKSISSRNEDSSSFVSIGVEPLMNSKNVIFLEELDSLSYRILAFAFPLLTLGILSGAVWANEAWGSYWSWDPKETWAFITWLVFAFYLHTRLQYSWEGKKSAFVATFGFFIVWVCYLGVNLLGKGLHSYGWLS